MHACMHAEWTWVTWQNIKMNKKWDLLSHTESHKEFCQQRKGERKIAETRQKDKNCVIFLVCLLCVALIRPFELSVDTLSQGGSNIAWQKNKNLMTKSFHLFWTGNCHSFIYETWPKGASMILSSFSLSKQDSHHRLISEREKKMRKEIYDIKRNRPCLFSSSFFLCHTRKIASHRLWSIVRIVVWVVSRFSVITVSPWAPAGARWIFFTFFLAIRPHRPQESRAVYLIFIARSIEALPCSPLSIPIINSCTEQSTCCVLTRCVLATRLYTERMRFDVEKSESLRSTCLLILSFSFSFAVCCFFSSLWTLGSLARWFLHCAKVKTRWVGECVIRGGVNMSQAASDEFRENCSKCYDSR